LTGRYSRRTGIGLVFTGSDEELPYEEVTIAEALADARGPLPWARVALGKWNLATEDSDRAHPNLQGFDHFSGIFTVMSEIAWPQNNYFDWLETTDGVDVGRSTVYNTTDIVDDAIAQVNTLPEPFFLYLPVNAPHDPLHVPPAGLTSEVVTDTSTPAELHRAVLQAADTELARFLAAIPPDVRANTTIVLTADNGTQPEAVEPPYLSAHAKRSVYEGGVHVPLIVTGPLVSRPGARSDALVHIVDVFATVADIAGVPLVDLPDEDLGFPLPNGLNRPVDGLSLLPYLRDPDAPSQREHVFVEQFSPNGAPPYALDWQGLRDATHKLVRIDGVEELYALDPKLGEVDDLLADGVSTEEQAIADRLRGELDHLLATTPFGGGGG
jgi:arylsulfatase A-like enzyme